MNFVDGVSCAKGVSLVALLHPLAVVPFVVEVPNDGCGTRGFFIPERDGIGFINAIAVAIRIDVKFIQ
jgi:hypothetical protein